MVDSASHFAKSNGNSKAEETTFAALLLHDTVSRLAKERPTTRLDLLFDLPTNDWTRQE